MALFFFFFQAEDGIRDYKVTGVQTCALPISGAAPGVLPGLDDRRGGGSRGRFPRHCPHPLREIGRASCRESVDLGGRRIIKKKKKTKKRRREKTNYKDKSRQADTRLSIVA